MPHGTIRAAGVAGLRAEAQERGMDAAALVRAGGLDPAILDHPDVPVPADAVAHLLDASADALGLPDLGLRLAARHELAMLGPIALVITNARTGDDALDAAARFLRYHSDAIRVAREPDPDGDPTVARIAYAAHVGLRPVPVHSIDAGLGFLHRTVGLLLGPDYHPVRVELPHLPAAPARTYEEFFGAPVAFGAPTAALHLRASLLGRSIEGARDDLRAQAEAHLRALLPDELDVVASVQQLVRSTLALGAARIEDVARVLSLHPRTLQRRLAAEHTTYERVVDDVRRDEARRLLTLTDEPLLTVSARLGYAEQATFTRASRRWWGVPPRAVRARRARA